MRFLRGLAVQAEVVHALILRETRTRFGAYSLGYLWALLEPIFVILTFFVFFTVAGRRAPVGMDLWTFIATGIVTYHLFSHSVARVAESVNGNRALLFYPQVFPLDLAIARALLEWATEGGVFLALIAMHAMATQRLVMDEPMLIVFGLTLSGLLGSALGLVFAALGQLSNVADRLRGPLLRPLFWVSGIFFTAAAIPERVRGVALWNPVLHCTELVRAGLFESYGAEHARPGYVLAWILGLALIGLSLERVVRERIELT